MSDGAALSQFLAQHSKPYDIGTDSYDRPPFASDIKEGKNDPIYNAHSYHTKVPPRSIIPYILHYTEPGDLIFDPFCGSGMTGVAAQMCANPPADILEQFPELKERVGLRACILNDLSPAACHIAYNYNAPVDVEALKREFERIKMAVKDEFDWLYGTEHYEPAVGSYDTSMSDVAGRLKNPPVGASPCTLLGNEERTWELLTKAEVEERLGYPVTELPRGEEWGEIEASKVGEWVCIPAKIQYTVWSDVYRCEGFVAVEEPTGKVSTRGKNVGKPIIAKKRVARGCGAEIVIWEVAVDSSGAVAETFKCPRCTAAWKKMQLSRLGAAPVVVNFTAVGIKQTRKGVEAKRIRYNRRITAREKAALNAIQNRAIPYWVPITEMDTKGPQYRRNALQVRNIKKVTDFWTKRNLWAYASTWARASSVPEPRIAEVLRFALTGIAYYVTKKQPWGSGGGGLSGQLYLSSLPLEKNVWEVFERKVEQLLEGYASARSLQLSQTLVLTGSATALLVPDGSVDYVFADPPFGSNIYYSEPNLLWEAWLGRITDTSEEAVVHRKNDGGTKRLPDYARLMEAAFKEIARILKPGRWATVEFNNSDGAVFEVIKQAIRGAGFEIVNMLLLDKEQKTFKQVKGAGGVEDVVDKDVLFNLHKPAVLRAEVPAEDRDLEHQVADAVRQYLQILPERIMADPGKYNDEHRTTATINSMLMNTLIPRGVGVERLNLPFIERVCARYFRKIGQRWYLRGEAVGVKGGEGLFTEESAIADELTAIAWLRQKLHVRPMLIGELRPLWMRATGLLAAELSQTLSLEDLLAENFWRDLGTNRWREPKEEERERMNDDLSLRVLHDAERFTAGSLRRSTSDSERCDWIDVLFKACNAVEEKELGAIPALRGFDDQKAYVLITRLFQGVLNDNVEPGAFQRAEKQARVASQRLNKALESEQEKVEIGKRKERGPTLFDGIKDE
jgi:DNA modification methylase